MPQQRMSKKRKKSANTVDEVDQNQRHNVQEEAPTIVQSAIFMGIQSNGTSGTVLNINKSIMDHADELELSRFVAIRWCKGESTRYLHPLELTVPICELRPIVSNLKFCGLSTLSLVSPENQCLRWGKPYFSSLAPWEDIDQTCSITGLQMGPMQTFGHGSPQPAFVNNISDNIFKKDDGTLENIHASHMVELLKQDGYIESFARRVVYHLAQPYTRVKESHIRKRERRAWSTRQQDFKRGKG
jgi:hypothetical protein